MKGKMSKQPEPPAGASPKVAKAGSALGEHVLLLAFGAAGVDAVVILGFNVLTAAQTGNTILLATALARGDFATGLSSALSVASYVAGAALGEWVLVRGARQGAHLRKLQPESQDLREHGRPARVGVGLAASLQTGETPVLPALGNFRACAPRQEGSAAGKVLVLEILLLAAALLVWRMAGQALPQGIGLTIVALAALAMGLQSAAVRGIHAKASTTYITGVLTNFTTDLVEWLLPQRRAAGAGSGEANKPRESPWWNGVVWVIYLAGAVLNGLLFLRIGELALIVPLAVLALCASRLGKLPVS